MEDAEIKQLIKDIDIKLDKKFTKIDVKLDEKYNSLDTKLDKKHDEVDAKLEKKVDELHNRVTKTKDEQTLDDKDLRVIFDGLKNSFTEFIGPIAAMGEQCKTNKDSISNMNKILIGVGLTALGTLVKVVFFR